MSDDRIILFCHCARANVVPDDVRREVQAALADCEADVRRTEDLCGLAARRDPLLKDLAGTERLDIVACFPRAVRWLFDASGAPLDLQRVWFLNMRTQNAEEILRELSIRPLPGGLATPKLPAKAGRGSETSPSAGSSPRAASASEREIVASDIASDDWMPWFPVIDRDRCIGCGQCMNFCLFGVYAAEGERIEVRHPAACKTHCPACARICPQQAIVFPKHPSAPINGGDPPAGQEDATRVDLSALLGGNVYDAIRRREGGGASADLRKLQEQLDIPDQVVESLTARRPVEADRPCDCDCGCDCLPAGAGDSEEPDVRDQACDCDCGCDCGGSSAGPAPREAT